MLCSRWQSQQQGLPEPCGAFYNVSINLHYTLATSLPMECIFPALPDGSGASKIHLHGYEVYAKLLLTPSFSPVSLGDLGILPNVALNFNLGSCENASRSLAHDSHR